MAKLHRLTQKQINDAHREEVETNRRMIDGGGLSLHLRKGGSMYWSVQVTVKAAVGHGKRIEVGLGHYPDIDLKQARALASEARATASEGMDPREERKAKVRANQRQKLTFGQVCTLCYEARKAELKGEGKNGKWMSPLENYALPTLADTPIEEITQHDLVEMLKPFWYTRAPVTAKCINRIGIVFKHAAALDLDVSLETVPKAQILLGKQKHTERSIPSMQWQEVPAFYASLNEDVTAELALKLLILTGSRSGPVRFASADQFADGVWTIPGENMKGGHEFQIPLSDEAQRIVDVAIKASTGRYLFMAPMGRNAINDSAMKLVMEGRGLDARPHGYRSTLRDWLTEETNCPWDTREKLLAHSVGTKVTRAYDRSKDLKRGAVYLEKWARFVTGQGADVVQLRTA